MTYAEIRLQLMREIDDKYQEFVSKGTPTDRPILGIRIPTVRKIAMSVPREDIEKILAETPFSFEEVLLRGMLIARLPYAEMLKYFDSQVDLINDWGACDTFCAAIRLLVKNHRNEFLDQKIEPLLTDPREFAVRVGLVLLLGSYVTPDYLALIFDRIEGLKDREEYYIRMGIAWLLAECFIKYPDATAAYLKVTKLPKWTFNKTISKICDSYRVDPDVKSHLRTLRK